MRNVYIALKISVTVIVLLFSQTVFSQPVITSFFPDKGPAGTMVIIKGTGFNTSSDSNIVYFGSVKALLLYATPDSLIVIVPTGATHAPITVSNRRFTANSRLAFNVTYTKGDTALDSTSFTSSVDVLGIIHPRTGAIDDLNGKGKANVTILNK